ncbi:MAG: hypothetical protein NZ561_00200 [Phycisphaerae bacterium]|nr:hypothetical protein [Phycisphaerae bacterium]MDW8263064.1 hypothetical protein [Phycisphaerales bacterium]
MALGHLRKRTHWAPLQQAVDRFRAEILEPRRLLSVDPVGEPELVDENLLVDNVVIDMDDPIWFTTQVEPDAGEWVPPDDEMLWTVTVFDEAAAETGDPVDIDAGVLDNNEPVDPGGGPVGEGNLPADDESNWWCGYPTAVMEDEPLEPVEILPALPGDDTEPLVETPVDAVEDIEFWVTQTTDRSGEVLRGESKPSEDGSGDDSNAPAATSPLSPPTVQTKMARADSVASGVLAEERIDELAA